MTKTGCTHSSWVDQPTGPWACPDCGLGDLIIIREDVQA